MKTRWIPYLVAFLFFGSIGFYGVKSYQNIEDTMSSPTFELLAKSNFNFLSAMTIDEIVLEDREKLNSFIDQALSHDWGIKMIRFEDREGDVLGEWQDPNWSRIKTLIDRPGGYKGYYFLKSPVIIQGEPFGSISIGYDFRKMETFSLERTHKIKKLGLYVLLMLMAGMPAPFFVYDQWPLIALQFKKVKTFILNFKKKPEEDS